MKTFNFAKFVFIFVIVALFGDFRNTQHEVSTVTFEQSFLRLKLRKPLSGKERKDLEKQVGILKQKLGEAELGGKDDKVKFLQTKIKRAEEKLKQK